MYSAMLAADGCDEEACGELPLDVAEVEDVAGLELERLEVWGGAADWADGTPELAETGIVDERSAICMLYSPFWALESAQVVVFCIAHRHIHYGTLGVYRKFLSQPNLQGTSCAVADGVTSKCCAAFTHNPGDTSPRDHPPSRLPLAAPIVPSVRAAVRSRFPSAQAPQQFQS
jgi:hypothetical protein